MFPPVDSRFTTFPETCPAPLIFPLAVTATIPVPPFMRLFTTIAPVLFIVTPFPPLTPPVTMVNVAVLVNCTAPLGVLIPVVNPVTVFAPFSVIVVAASAVKVVPLITPPVWFMLVVLWRVPPAVVMVPPVWLMALALTVLPPIARLPPLTSNVPAAVKPEVVAWVPLLIVIFA
jgi:hypothetical protein